MISLHKSECVAVRKYALSFTLLASFQTVSEVFQGFYNIFIRNEFSLLSFSPGEYLLIAAEAAKMEGK